ncbi:8-amino-7-oxononanoate synthase [Stieleria sp. TO1_6]|uniref:aminotransferase class I/II-fold pyridoxal phosphate-dependent enzyme n=1 Tax=Stieleria tagensis TaxID=2956795 RepID=UPI00209ABE30|nr:8-amino-7-oxononanoate synthase [Stieleria tagensis]MCO8124666.1 8-amino-7-oxononanoate synthase [Stieleria tagensis]
MWNDLAETLDDLQRRGRRRRLRRVKIEGVHLIDDQRRRLVNFGGNDYLGLAAELASAIPAVGSMGATASGLVCGWTERHQQLAQRIADLEQTESAVIFPTGFAACSGTAATLGRERDLILSDALNHASLIDGCRLAKAQCIVYPHRDDQTVGRILAERRGEFDRVWIVTDSVFSMHGHVAPLEQLCDLADQYQATVVVDEAHATGVLGETGSGACEALGVKHRVPIRIGTLSKALGGQGGFVAGPQVVIDYLINHCRPLIFSTALSLPAVEAGILAIHQIDTQPQRRRRVGMLARQVRQALGGRCDGVESGVPIIPIVIGADQAAVDASQRLYELGMFVPAIRPPTVPEGEARLRVSLSAEHDDQMILRLIDALKKL